MKARYGRGRLQVCRPYIPFVSIYIHRYAVFGSTNRFPNSRTNGSKTQIRLILRPVTRGLYPLTTKKYAPLIASMDLAAELDIIFLRQQARGQLIGQGGDIDNRLKTLFDALRMPSKGEVQQLGTAVDQDDDPLHCLLQDDVLIHRVNVETDRLLKSIRLREKLSTMLFRAFISFAL
jgi:hypothetical protein